MLSLIIAKTLKPPPKLTVSQWADAERRLSPEASAEAGKWVTARAEYQRGIMDAFSDPTVETVVVMTGSQVGKALAIDTPIATIQGWTTMGELCLGDMVFDADGMPTKVIGVSDIMYKRPCFEVKLSDGSVITADAEHLWEVDDDKDGRKVVTTAEMLCTYKYGVKKPRNRYAIRVAKPLMLPEVELPIDPYTLGAWLGDGHSASSRIFGARDDLTEIAGHIASAGHRVTIKPDKTCYVAVIDEKLPHICPRGHDKNIVGWSGKACAICACVNATNYVRKKNNKPLRQNEQILATMPRLLNAMGLLGNKCIPSIYLRASKNQRMALLQGLMDTDGSVSIDGRQEFTTTSEKLRDGMAELLSTLGIKYTVKIRQPKTSYKGKVVYGAKAYRFSFMAYADTPVFRLRRKLARQVSNDKNRRSTETLRRRIVAITQTSSVPVRCILVDNENHLFLAGREMIPTHNTEIINNGVGYFISQDPAPILVVQPTLDMAQTWSKDRLAPMLRDTPCLAGKVKDPRSRDSGNTTLHKVFSGGHVTACGANSPASLASRPIRVVFCDEVDRYPASAGSEGDPVSLAKRRAATFWNRKILMVSTPTIKGVSRIEASYEASDKRKYHVPCPHCGGGQILKWKQVIWDDGKPETACYHCEFCGVEWSEAERIRAIAKGKWIAEEPFKGIAGFWLNGLYSPWTPLPSAAAEFIEAKKYPETLKTWTNTYLGESWEDRGDRVDDLGLYERREEYDFPEGPVLVTAGVDVQDDRIEVEFLGIGRDEETWSIDYQTLHGDPSGNSVWTHLDELLKQTWKHKNGKDIRVVAACIDSGGHHTQAVYNFVRGKEGRRIFAIKGIGGEGKPLVARPTLNNSGRIKLFPVGVDTAKELVYARLRINEVGAGYCHFPARYDEEYFRQLTAEQCVIRFHKGYKRREWQKIRPRNEALDCRVYAVAAYGILNARIDYIADKYEEPVAPSITPVVEETVQEKREKPIVRQVPRRRNSFVNNWR